MDLGLFGPGHGFGPFFSNFGLLGLYLSHSGPIQWVWAYFGPILGALGIDMGPVSNFMVPGLFRPISGILGMDLDHIRPISVIRELAGLFWSICLNLRLVYAYLG